MTGGGRWPAARALSGNCKEPESRRRHLKVTVKTNLDGKNYEQPAALLDILAAEGLAGKLTVRSGSHALGRGGIARRMGRECSLASSEFAPSDREFAALAARSGFAAWSPPTTDRADLHGSVRRCSRRGRRRRVVPLPGPAGQAGGSDWGHPEHPCDWRRLRYLPGVQPVRRRRMPDLSALPVCMGGCPDDAALRQRHPANRCHEFGTHITT